MPIRWCEEDLCNSIIKWKTNIRESEDLLEAHEMCEVREA